MSNNVILVKPMYPCQSVPVVAFGERCLKPCLYCDLYSKQFANKQIIASGRNDILKKLQKFKGAYFSAVADCFLPVNSNSTHYLLEHIWKEKKDFVPLIVTKQIIPNKSIKLLIKNKHRVVVQISLSSLNQRILSLLEPGAAPIIKRLELIKKLIGGGVPVIVVVMPWFDIYEKNESIEDLPKVLSEIGVKRCIIGTAVLPEPQKQRITNLNDKLILQAVNKMTATKQVTTKIGYTLPFRERILAFRRLINACHKFGIKAKICTADNLDLINKTKLPLCTKFQHNLFRKK